MLKQPGLMGSPGGGGGCGCGGGVVVGVIGVAVVLFEVDESHEGWGWVGGYRENEERDDD